MARSPKYTVLRSLQSINTVFSAAIRQAIAKAIVAYNQKCEIGISLFLDLTTSADVDEATKQEIKDILLQYDRSLLVADQRRCEPKK